MHSFIISTCLLIITLSIFSFGALFIQKIKQECPKRSWLTTISYSLLIALLISSLLSKFDKTQRPYFSPYILIISVTCLTTFFLLLVRGIVFHNSKFKELFGLVGLYALTILPDVSRNEFPIYLIAWLVSCILVYVTTYCCSKK